MSGSTGASPALPDELRLLAANERAMESLYEEYARHLPQHREFWSRMASEERRHAEWIERLGTTSTRSSIQRPRFTVEAIRAFTAYVMKHRRSAIQGTTMAAAAATAHNLETALIERRFFEQLPQQSPEVARVLASLKKETKKHVRETRDALTRFGNQSVADTQ